MPDDCACVFGAVIIQCTMYRLSCFFLCFFDVLNDVVKGQTKLSSAGVPFNAVVMPFDDVGKCCDAEIVRLLF